MSFTGLIQFLGAQLLYKMEEYTSVRRSSFCMTITQQSTGLMYWLYSIYTVSFYFIHKPFWFLVAQLGLIDKGCAIKSKLPERGFGPAKRSGTRLFSSVHWGIKSILKEVIHHYMLDLTLHVHPQQLFLILCYTYGHFYPCWIYD